MFGGNGANIRAVLIAQENIAYQGFSTREKEFVVDFMVCI